ncbi:MAG: PAS domain S-box protein [Verrucomicrobiota bacterium]
MKLIDSDTVTGVVFGPLPTRISPENLEAFVSNLPGIAWIIDADGRMLVCNRKLCELAGLTKEEIVGKQVSDLFGAELADICVKNRQAILDTGENQEFVQTIPTCTGDPKEYLIKEFLLEGSQGETYFGGIGTDITVQLSIESELKESKKRLSRLNRLYSVLSQINEIIVRSTEKQKLLTEVCRIIVAKAEIQLAWAGLYHEEEDRVEPLASYGPHTEYVGKVKIETRNGEYSFGPAARAIRTGVYATANHIKDDHSFRLKPEAETCRFESCGVYPFEYGNGQRGILLIYSSLENYFEVEENQLFQSLADDLSYAMHSITSEQRANSVRAELTNHERQLATLFGNLPGMAYRCELDESWTMNFISEGCLEVTGYHPEDLIGNKVASFEDLILEDDREWVREDVNLALSRKTRYELTYRIQHRSKGVRWMWERGQGVFDEMGHIMKLEGFISDVTDQQITYSRMRNQAELIDKAHNAIIVCDQAGTILFWNQGATRLYGFPKEQVEGMPIKDVLKTRGERLHDAVREVRRAGEWSGELIRVCADGTEKTVESRWTTASDEQADDDGTILTIDSDITERRNLERQFLRAQRMESVGNLAGGIAHDLNNILSPIMMSAELLEDVVTGEQEQRILHRISDGTRRAADMVQHLLSFSHGLESSRKTLDTNQLANDMQTLVQDAISEEIKLSFEVEDDLPQIRANPVQLNQVLLNLSVNARDAMNGKGKLSILIYKNVKTQVPPEIIPGNFVVIEVTDTGGGISEELKEQIFEPFFSTKTKSGGTGLGLSTSLSIVQNHGGFIDLDSEIEKGTTFRVFMPALGMKLAEDDIQIPSLIRQDRTESVLVVDDESSMRSVLAQTLEKLNYNVETASDGQEALNFLEKRPDTVFTVLTDINMPILNGIEFARVLRKKYPCITVIGMSGFEQESSRDDEQDLEELFDVFLPKPFTTSELSSVLEKYCS